MCAVNRFDRPIDATFINTYSPIPFEQMMQAGAMKQQRYDQSAAAMDATIARAEDINAIPNSQDALERDQALEQMYNIRDKYAGKDLSNSMVVRQLNNEIRSAVNPSDIKRWESSFSGWQNYKKNEAAMTARGQRIYNPTDFTGYDSSVQGAFTGLPTMDLGAQAEVAIDKFLKKPQVSPYEKPLPSGRIAIAHARSGEEMSNLIENEAGELLNNPAIQQLMEREGMDEGRFKEFLRGRAPSYLTEQWTSTYAPPGADGGGTSYLDTFESRLPGEGKVENINARKLKREIEKDRQQVVANEELLSNMEEEGSGYTDEQIENQRAANEAENNIYLAKQAKHDSVVSGVEDEFAKSRTAVYDEYLGLLMTDGGLSAEEAKQVLDAASEKEVEPPIDEEAGRAENIARGVGRSVGGAFKGIGETFASIGKKMTDTNAGLIENYKDELDAVGVQQKKREKEALAQAFSQTTTTDEIVLRQQKDNNGYVEVRGVDGKMHDSFITAAVTNPLLNHPEKFTISSTNPKVKKNPAEYVRLAKQDEDWNLDIRSISGASSDGEGVDIFYDLTGPKEKKEGTIVVTLTDPYQIENVTKDLLTQGSVIAASQLTHRYLSKMATLNEGKKEASYPIYKRNPDPETQSDNPTLQDSANVSFDANTGIYSIKIGSTEVATARSSYELGALLVDLQLLALGLEPQ